MKALSIDSGRLSMTGFALSLSICSQMLSLPIPVMGTVLRVATDLSNIGACTSQLIMLKQSQSSIP
jgi:hypothetical protein